LVGLVIEFAEQALHTASVDAEHATDLKVVPEHFVHGIGRYESPGQKCSLVHVVQTEAREYFPAGHGEGNAGHDE
jgi:hypothetical protein